MIPKSQYTLTVTTDEETIEIMPSVTFRLDYATMRMGGLIDGLDAIMQAVQLILNTERFAWVIYDERMGAEFEQFIGKDMPFAKAVLESRIRDAVTQDDRVQGISNFSISKTAIDTLYVTLTVNTKMGAFDTGVEVYT